MLVVGAIVVDGGEVVGAAVAGDVDSVAGGAELLESPVGERVGEGNAADDEHGDGGDQSVATESVAAARAVSCHACCFRTDVHVDSLAGWPRYDCSRWAIARLAVDRPSRTHAGMPMPR